MAIRMHATHPALGEPGLCAVSDTRPRAVVESDWRLQLPVLANEGVLLRQLRFSDAAPLFMLLTTEEVARFISPPPTTAEGFQQFIVWALERQRQGRVAFFAVVPRGSDTPVGLFQLRALDAGFTAGECGFAMGSPYWGTGLFLPCAELLQRFAFDEVGVARLEARSMVENARGNGALRKMGAVVEGILRQSFEKNGQRYDQYLWSILADEWRETSGIMARRRAAAEQAVVKPLPASPSTASPNEELWSAGRSPIIVRLH